MRRRKSSTRDVIAALAALLGAVDFVLAETEYPHTAIERAFSDLSGVGIPLRVLRIEDVVVHELIAGRPRDIEDILARRPERDERYRERWVSYWDVGRLWQQLRARSAHCVQRPRPPSSWPSNARASESSGKVSTSVRA